MSREIGWYSAKFAKNSNPEIVFYNGYDCQRTHGFYNRMTEEFYWISDKPIVPEEPPVVFEVGSWYLFTDRDKIMMIGQCKAVDSGLKYIWVADSKWWYLDKVEILAGPFTADELMELKPF